jgi:membrane protein DedA with SNARE-associated domain
MSGSVEFLVRHGYLLLFGWVLAEQFGLPLPSMPLLLAAGSLARTHQMNLAVAIALPIAAVVICDALWYRLGCLKGAEILHWLCRISFTPDTCVRRTQICFERAPWVLVVAKFFPGLSAMAPPLAGIGRMPWQRYALFDGLGTLLWAGAYIGAGYAFSGELDHAAAHLAFLGPGLFSLLPAGLLFYTGWKYFNRQ